MIPLVRDTGGGASLAESDFRVDRVLVRVATFKDWQPSKKLQDWPDLSLNQFLKELDKQKIKLSVSAHSEWMPYFESEKAKANAIQQLID
jgi:hypothetical protein